MNKKGFTLVELLAVIIILGLVIAIISPVVSNLLKDSKDSLSKQQKEMIITASKKYMIEHSELLPEGSDHYIIYMDDLIDKGAIDNDSIVDPKTHEEINGCVVVSYNNEFNQYDYNYSNSDNDCFITVTFDPEGGSVTETSRQVRLNSTYGALPTPTRDGYTFVGWRGKNMFDEETILMAISEATYEDGYYIFPVKYAHMTYGGITGNTYVGTNQMNINFKENTQYTLTINGYSEYIEDNNRHCNLYYGFFLEDGKKIGTISAENTYKMTNDPNTTVDKISFSYGILGNAYISYIQLEEGTTATEYEPYQRYDSDTIVTKYNNHTLHAIWEVES